MYLKIALLLYFTTLIACLTLSILFKLSKAGPFRNQFMFFFMSLSWGLCSRFLDVSQIMPVDLLFVISPLCLSSVWLVWAITHYRPDKG